jgi:UDPglucose 6-dehydrogenase
MTLKAPKVFVVSEHHHQTQVTLNGEIVVKGRISVVGLGYVGLCTAIFLAAKGHKVKVSSQSSEKVKQINNGVPPFYEPQLEDLLKKVVHEGSLAAVLGREKAIVDSEVTFICVGTPSLPDGNIDLRFVRESAAEIGKALKKKDDYHLVVVKSTVIPGATENLVRPIIEKNSGKAAGDDFGLVMSPEFLREGSAVYDTFHPDRIVIGEFDEHSGDVFEKLCKQTYGDEVPILRVNCSTAEMTKYASNAFLATKVSFINEIANICELVPRVDVVKVAQGMGLDPRIGSKFLNAGVGWGGSCFPKDVKALIAFSRSERFRPLLLESVVQVNLDQAKHVVTMMKKQLGSLSGKKIAVLGLSFKPNTEDMREAPSIRIINTLCREDAIVHVYDPMAMKQAREILGNKVNLSPTVRDCLRGADCCLIVTEWDQFKKLEPHHLVKLMKTPFILDGRRIYDPDKFLRKVQYKAIGLGTNNRG